MQGLAQPWEWGQCCGTVLGASGVPWDPPDHAGRTRPGDRAGRAKFQKILCWIEPKWLLDRVFLGVIHEPPSGLGRSSSFGESSPSFRERSPLFGDSVHCPPPAGSLEAPVSRGGFSVPCFWGTLGLFGAGAGSCAELPHVLSLSPAPMSPRVAGITLQLPDLPADVCMCVSPSSPHAPSPSLPVPLPGVPDWDPTWGRGCL